MATEPIVWEGRKQWSKPEDLPGYCVMRTHRQHGALLYGLHEDENRRPSPILW